MNGKNILSDISVISPAYNAKLFIQSAVLVMVPFIMKGVEWIIIDDASEDNTADRFSHVLKRMDMNHEKGFRIAINRLASNSGPITARNIGLSTANGRYIAFLDVDDVWLPGKLEIQLEYMQKKKAGIIFSDYRHMSFNGDTVGRLVSAPDRVNFATLHRTRGIGCLTVMIDRHKISDFRFPNLPRNLLNEDFLAWASILRQGFVAERIPIDLARYRLSPESRSSSKMRAAISTWKIYRDVEKLSFWQSAIWFAEYAIRAKYKHLNSYPQYPRAEIDGEHASLGVIASKVN